MELMAVVQQNYKNYKNFVKTIQTGVFEYDGISGRE